MSRVCWTCRHETAVTVNCNKNGPLLLRVKPARPCLMHTSTTPPDVLHIFDSGDLVCLLRSRLGHPPWFADLLHSMYFATYACIIGSEQTQPCERFHYQPPAQCMHHEPRDELGSLAWRLHLASPLLLLLAIYVIIFVCDLWAGFRLRRPVHGSRLGNPRALYARAAESVGWPHRDSLTMNGWWAMTHSMLTQAPGLHGGWRNQRHPGHWTLAPAWPGCVQHRAVQHTLHVSLPS